MKKKLPYPKHIIEPIRAEVALVYLKCEMRKLLPKVRGKTRWKEIDSGIDQWFTPNDLIGLRDFWNGFHGIAMGSKLKIGLVQVLTAENIKWRLEKKLPLDDKLAFGGNLRYISKELSEKRPTTARLKKFFKENTGLVKKWKKELERHGKSSEPRDHFPIIAVEEIDNGRQIFSIHDGNRRAILAVLRDRSVIPAYVGSYKTTEKIPKNFWLPTSFLMEFVKEAEMISNEENYPKMLSILRGMISLSKAGQYELRERVLIGENQFRMRLKKDLGWEK